MRRFHLVLLEDGGDLAALLGRQLGRAGGGSLTGGGVSACGAGGLGRTGSCFFGARVFAGLFVGLGFHVGTAIGIGRAFRRGALVHFLVDSALIHGALVGGARLVAVGRLRRLTDRLRDLFRAGLLI